MKIHSLSDSHYINYFLRRHKFLHVDYEKYQKNVKFSEEDLLFIDRTKLTMHIDLYPYCYTMQKVSRATMLHFLTFISHYFRKANIPVYEYSVKDSVSNIDILLSIIKQSPLILVSTLLMMQYYFL